jgi:hypothetical protein
MVDFPEESLYNACIDIEKRDAMTTYNYRNAVATIEKKEFYCKAGLYEHKHRTGWVLVVGGEVVLGNEVRAPIERGAASYEYPKFTTKKSLVAWITEEE